MDGRVFFLNMRRKKNDWEVSRLGGKEGIKGCVYLKFVIKWKYLLWLGRDIVLILVLLIEYSVFRY